MFSPSPADVRRFFCSVYAKWRAQQNGAIPLAPMQPIEQLAALWIAEHPEYFDDLADADAAVTRNYEAAPYAGRTNPFLHLSMHLSISEQCSIDQPRGVRQAIELLAKKRTDLHAAHHAAMECLGLMLAQAQASRGAPDGASYVAALQRLATRD